MRTQQIITGILFAIGAAVAVYTATRPDYGLLKFSVRGTTAYGNGSTNGSSVSQVGRFLDNNPDVEKLVFRWMSGTSDADRNLLIARKIRKLDLHTHLNSNSFIASGAVDLFLAGTTRTMECGARIGVHSWSSGNGKIYPALLTRDPQQKKHEKFLGDMGIDPAFYVFTREAALPDDLHILTSAEIEQFGLLTEPLDCD